MSSRLKEMSRLAPPPRQVSTPLVLRILTSGCGLQFGAIWVLFLMLMLWIAGGFEALRGTRHLLGETAVVPGRVTDYEESNLEINERTVYAVFYTFQVGEQEYEGVSFTTGSRYSTGQAANVEYALNKPSASKLENGRSNPFPFTITLLFGAVGLVPILFSLWGAFKAAHFLRHGRLGEAHLVSSEGTNMTVNDQPVMAYTFSYEPMPGRPHEFVVKTHEGHKVTDEEREPVLYLPGQPEKVMLFDQLPYQPVLTPSGNFGASSGVPWMGLLLPGMVLGGMLYALYLVSV